MHCLNNPFVLLKVRCVGSLCVCPHMRHDLYASSAVWCSLIRASRPANRADKGYKTDPPWGHPEPVTRDQLDSLSTLAVRQSAGLAGGADSLIPGQARHQHGSLPASGPARDQVRSWHCSAICLQHCQEPREIILCILTDPSFHMAAI